MIYQIKFEKEKKNFNNFTYRIYEKMKRII